MSASIRGTIKTLNAQFRPIAEALAGLPFDALLDGEIVALDKSGKADFQLLQNYLRSGRGELVYYVFDLLYCNGRDLRVLPLTRRKSVLARIVAGRPFLKLSEHVEARGEALFQAAKEADVEGIVAKDGASPYRSGQRGREWLKVKTHLRQEAVIAGFTQPRGGRSGFGTLVLGVYEDASLVYIGHAGGGFTDARLTALYQRLAPLATKKSPFDKPPATNTPVTWVVPELVCGSEIFRMDERGVYAPARFYGSAGRHCPFGRA